MSVRALTKTLRDLALSNSPVPENLLRLLTAARDGDCATVGRLTRADGALCLATLTTTSDYGDEREAAGASRPGRPANWCELLLGPRMNIFDSHGGMGAFHVAGFAGHLSVVTLLLAAGAPAAAGLEAGTMPPVLAAMNDQTDVAETLLESCPAASPAAMPPLAPEVVVTRTFAVLMLRGFPPSHATDDVLSVLEVEAHWNHPDSLLRADRLVRFLADAGRLHQVSCIPLVRMYRKACWAIAANESWLGRCIVKDGAARGFITSDQREICNNALDATDRIRAAKASVDDLRSSLNALASAAARGERQDAKTEIREDAATLSP
ncbi:hypothetical protein I4F81_007702 [Pyropia yezoensis]|uniref:Uncharacterized protein n=1 Tax=Pyropia yezoensis TaxID=2788 RepID=A0ACC3C5S3_PYRYE|nr:hypothetical protein I4F81_007702 [Neopyropia yezoensis]